MEPDIYDELQGRLRQIADETDGQIAAQRTRVAADHRDYDAWKVTVPEYDHDGVRIERFEVSKEEQATSMLRAAFNPQRGDRSVLAGNYTRLVVDGVIWMSDTPAEIRDLDLIDDQMADVGLMRPHGVQLPSMLIVGLGLGMILHRAIVTHQIPWIDVVESDARVLRAVQPHYEALARDHNVSLRVHNSGIHEWRPPHNSYWDLGFFDIWAHIDADDLPEVTRLRKRFYNRLGHFEAWAQKERLAQKRRIASGKWAY